MKSFRVYLMLGGMTLALLSSIQASYAADKVKSESQSPKVDETSPRQDRGASFTSLMQPANIQAAAGTVKIAPQTTNAKGRSQRTSIIAKKKVIQQGTTAKLPAKIMFPAQKTSPVMNVSHTSQISGSVVAACLDRSGSAPTYKIGDKLAVNVSAGTDCNILVFNYDSNGILTQIFPNDYQQSGLVRGGETVTIGGPDSPFDYQISGKGGTEKIFVYAYPIGTEKPLEVALNQVPGSPFRTAEMTPEKYRELVNSSKSFFSREVKVVPKKNIQPVATMPAAASANKIELTFSVEK